MINDLNVQHELIKSALSETDAYLTTLAHAKKQGRMPAVMARDFISHYMNAWKAFEALGVLSDHEGYMKEHLKTVWAMVKDEDPTLADEPYASVPGSEAGGGVDESVQIKEEDEEKLSDEDIQKIVDELTWEDVVDLYDDVELVYDPDEDGDDDSKEHKEVKEEFISEKLSVQARLKKRQAFARMRGKRNTARNIKLRRASSIEVLKKRATLAARRAVYKRFLRGRDKSTLSAAEKDRIEQQVGRMKYMQTAIATKMLPKMRSIEQKRLAGYRTKKK